MCRGTDGAIYKMERGHHDKEGADLVCERPTAKSKVLRAVAIRAKGSSAMANVKVAKFYVAIPRFIR